MLAGIVLVVGQAWVLWGRAWLDRAYLRTAAASVVANAELAYAREGLRAQVQATGMHEGRAYALRWTFFDGAVCLEGRFDGGTWERLVSPSAEGLHVWLTTKPR